MSTLGVLFPVRVPWMISPSVPYLRMELSEQEQPAAATFIRPENLDAWLDPDPKHLGGVYAILEDPIDAYYQHELVAKQKDS